MMHTLWKVPETQFDSKIEITRLEPVGDTVEVTDRLLEIPKIKPYFDIRFLGGHVAVIWEVRDVIISFKEEPEFGSPNVFSLQMEKFEFERDFFKLYVQIFENLGTTLLYNKKFILPKNFRKML